MDLIDTRKGEGTGIAKSGRTQVEYELEIYQHRTEITNDATVPTTQQVRGWIRPVFGDMAEKLTLELNDRSTLAFSFANKNGEIEADRGITPFGSS
jgi:hypothetical protein